LQQYEAPLVSAQAALHTEFHSVCWDEALLDLEEDEFFLPVGMWQLNQNQTGVLPNLHPAAANELGAAAGRMCAFMLSRARIVPAAS
jgi:hypothetical protein